MTLPDHEFVSFASYYFKGIVIDESLISVRRHEKNMTAIEKVGSGFQGFAMLQALELGPLLNLGELLK